MQDIRLGAQHGGFEISSLKSKKILGTPAIRLSYIYFIFQLRIAGHAKDFFALERAYLKSAMLRAAKYACALDL